MTMPDQMMTALQEVGQTGAFGLTIAEIVQALDELGIDPHTVKVQDPGVLVVDPERRVPASRFRTGPPVIPTENVKV